MPRAFLCLIVLATSSSSCYYCEQYEFGPEEWEYYIAWTNVDHMVFENELGEVDSFKQVNVEQGWSEWLGDDNICNATARYGYIEFWRDDTAKIFLHVDVRYLEVNLFSENYSAYYYQDQESTYDSIYRYNKMIDSLIIQQTTYYDVIVDGYVYLATNDTSRETCFNKKGLLRYRDNQSHKWERIN